MRIVSIVPSLTELLLDMGLDNQVVGRTKFCIHPNDKIKSIPKIGGTKNVNIEAVAQLAPDLIIANKEENTLEDVTALKELCPILTTDIPNYEEAIKAIEIIGERTHCVSQANALIEKINTNFNRLEELQTSENSVCYLIWKNPLMTIGRDTFIHDMLLKCGLRNVFGSQERYPSISKEEILDKDPDYIFLSSEPFPFKDKHILEFEQNFPNAKIDLVDGEYFSWYGSRMAAAPAYFTQLLTGI